MATIKEKKEYQEHQTHFSFFERLMKNSTDNSLQTRILLEILKELQFLNKK